MQMNDMVLISVDDHIIEPPDLFLGRLPDKFKGQEPRVARFENGDERWLMEGRKLASVAPSAVAGRNKEEMGVEPMRFSEVRRGVWDIDARIDDMNANGMLSSMNFSAMPGFAGERFISGQDKELMLALVQAYNDWHIEDWAGPYPGRIIPTALLPLWDVDLSIAEATRVAARGVNVVVFPEMPVNYGQPSVHSGHWDRLFAAIVDLDMTVAIHIGTSGGGAAPPSLDSPADVGNTLINIQIVSPVADLIFSPLLRKFPALRFAMSEGCMGWVPFLKERADAAYRNHRCWTHQDLGGSMPSDFIERNFLFCFHEDNFGLRIRHEIGINQISWECDYPHCDSTWPHSPEMLWEPMKDFPREEIDLITHGNAMRFLKFDPFAHVARAHATVGALRAKAAHIDVAPKSMGGQSPTRAMGALSTGDIRRFMIDAEQALGRQVELL